MLKYSWNQEKNKLLISTRGVGFEDIVKAIKAHKILKVAEHSNPSRYPKQKIMIIEIDKYTYCVPYIQKGRDIFLKTIYASRKYKYLLKETK